MNSTQVTINCVIIVQLGLMNYSMSICRKCHFLVWTEICLEYGNSGLLLPGSMWEIFLLCIFTTSGL